MQMSLQISFNECRFDNHDPEYIDYIALERGHLNLSGSQMDVKYQVDGSVACCNNNGYAINFTSAFSAAPQTILGDQMGEDG
jgi:hypothetical protein